MAEKLKIIEAVVSICKKNNGTKALEVLYTISYFAPGNINVEMLSDLVKNGSELGCAVRLLIQHSLVRLNHFQTVIEIDKKVQKIILSTLLDNGDKRLKFLEKALKIISSKGIDSSNLDHAISAWGYVTGHSQLIEKFNEIPSCIINELKNQIRYKEANTFGCKALDLLTKTNGENHPGTSILKLNIGMLLGLEGKHKQALEILVPLYEKNTKHNGRKEVRDPLIAIARQYGELCRFDEALEIYEQSLFRNEKVCQAIDAITLSAWHDYARVLCELGKYSEASTILKEVLKRHNQICKGEDDDALSIQSSIAHIFVKEGKYSEALKIYQRVYERWKSTYGDNHLITLRSRREIALIFAHQGKFDEALSIYDKVTGYFEQVLGNDHPETMAIQADVAALFQQRGEFQKALDTYKSVYANQVKILGEKHIDPLRVKYHIATILFIQENHDEALKTLKDVFDAYKEIFGPDHSKTLELADTLETLKNVNIETIYSAAREGNLSKIEIMIQNGADMNSTDFYGKTMLHYAAEYGRKNIVKFLLKKGAIYNIKSEEGKTPLQVTKNSKIKNLLNFEEKLMKYVKDGDYEQVSEIISKNQELVNAKDEDGSSPLHWAAYNGFKNIVELLLANDAKAIHVTNKGNTPLHIATSKGHKDIVEILLESRAEDRTVDFINAKTTNGRLTAVHVAAKKGFTDILKLLLKHGAIYNAKCQSGKTPLQLSNDQDTINLLKLVDNFHGHARTRNEEIIVDLEGLELDELEALMNARNVQGWSSMSRKYMKEITMKISEVRNKLSELESAPQSLFEQFEKLKQITESHLRSAIMYLNDLANKSQPFDSIDNPFPRFTLKQGSYYLQNVRELVGIYENSGLVSTDSDQLQLVKKMLVELEFDPTHITFGYTVSLNDHGESEHFDCKGQNTVYYNLLHSNFKSDVRLFLDKVESSIYVPVKSLFDSFKNKLKSMLCQDLLKAVENNDLTKIEDCVKKALELNLNKFYTESPSRYNFNTDHITFVNRLLSAAPYRIPVYTKDDVQLPLATCKKLEGIFEVLLQHISNENLNDFINYQTDVEGATLLHVAVKNGYFDIVKSLFNHGAIYNVVDKEGKVPLNHSRHDNITKLLKLVDELFEDAKNDNIVIIDKLKNTEPDYFLALTNARNNEGNTLLHIVITNKFKNIESKFIELFKKPDQIQSSSHINCGLTQLEELEQSAKGCVNNSLTYIREIKRDIFEACDSLTRHYPPRLVILERTILYFSSAFELVEKYKKHIDSEMKDVNIKKVMTTLSKEFQFHPSKISSIYVDDDDYSKMKRHKFRGLGDEKYFKILIRNGRNEMKSFIEKIERDIYIPIKNFFILINEKIQSVLSQKLLKAIENDNQSEVEDCISRGVDVNSTHSNGGTALHFAVNNGNLNIVKILLRNGAYPNQVTTKGNTPLHIATSKGHKDIVEVLLHHASRHKLSEFINAQTTVAGTTSLHVAAKNGLVDVVKSLLKYGAIYNVENKERKKPVEVSENRSIMYLLKLIDQLFKAAKNGHVQFIIGTLEHKEADEFLALANVRNRDENTTLEIATVNRYKNSKSKFIEIFKNPDKVKTLFKPKSKSVELEMMKELTDLYTKTAKLYILQMNSISQLVNSDKLIALKYGSLYLRNVDTFLKIYKRLTNGSIDNKDIRVVHDSFVSLEFKPEHLASYTEEMHVADAKSFVSKGQGARYYKLLFNKSKKNWKLFISDVECNIEVRVNKFFNSISEKLPDVVDEKESSKPAIETNGHSQSDKIDNNCMREESVLNSKTTEGNTPLHYAVQNGDLSITNVLLRNGADATLVTNKGDTPLHIATSKNYKEIVESLLEHVSQDKVKDFINVQTAGGETSLHIAAKNGYLDIVKCLLNRGATYNVQNDEGEIPLDISHDLKVKNLLKLIGQLFQDARSGDSGIIDKLQSAEPDDLIAITNACNTHDQTLWQIIVSNKDEDMASKYLKLFEKPQQSIQSRAPDRIWGLDKIETLKKAAETYIQSSSSYLPMLRNTSLINRSEKNAFPWATLKAGSYYLRNVYCLVETYKKCVDGPIKEENIYAVYEILIELEFDPKHITTGYTNEAYDGKIECFVSKGEGTRYYNLLHSEWKQDVRTFVEIIDPKIDVCVKKFLEMINYKFKFLLSEMLFQAIESNNNLEVRNCIKDKFILNLNVDDGISPLYYAVSKGNLSIINILLKSGANVTQVCDNGETVLHAASCKDQKRIVEVLLQNVSSDKLNDFINAQTKVGGDTSLHIAAKNGSFEVVETLLKQGAIYNLKNIEGKKALDLSKDDNVTNLLKLIDSLFADAKNGNTKIIRKLKTQLFKLSALMSTRNHQGKTIIEVATTNKHQSLADKLEMLRKSK